MQPLLTQDATAAASRGIGAKEQGFKMQMAFARKIKGLVNSSPFLMFAETIFFFNQLSDYAGNAHPAFFYLRITFIFETDTALKGGA